MSNDRYIAEVPDDRNTTVMEVTATSRPDRWTRRRGVRVTTAALAAAAGLGLGGGLLVNAVDAGAATTGATSGSTSSTGSTSTTPGGMPGGCTPPAAVGTVKSVGSDSFVLSTARGGTATVEVTTTTTYRDKGLTGASLSDVTVGEHVAVVGSSEDGTVTADTVLIGEPPSGTGDGPGTRTGTAPTGIPPSQGTGALPTGTPPSQGTGDQA